MGEAGGSEGEGWGSGRSGVFPPADYIGDLGERHRLIGVVVVCSLFVVLSHFV